LTLKKFLQKLLPTDENKRKNKTNTHNLKVRKKEKKIMSQKLSQPLSFTVSVSTQVYDG